MKKTKLIFLLLFSLLIFNGNNVFAQLQAEETIYKLKNNERIILKDENRIRFYNGKNGYLLFVERIEGNDTVYYANHNGKYLGPYDIIYYPKSRRDFQSIAQCVYALGTK